GALNGSVQARLNDLESNESELNKQVFALLVLNSFLPQGGGSPSNNIVANQARNSASQILTNQLNTLSDKFVKGIDINFDVNSYGGSAGEGNTDLSVNLAKSFADDRIIVKVGSTVALEQDNARAAQSQQVMTNVEVEYLLTPDGRYRLIAFSKTDLEDIVIGRITRSGGGFVFQKDFDRFRYLFDPAKTEEEQENEDDKAGTEEEMKDKSEKKEESQ
ncbi:MAG TPA: translocation/assembly module TamB domain-containing protein, partial [Cryomorphaceae bacterium]|nr:translocation/assembly module TamB domain-containing protein [Cryomorphaceae bacterium]